MPGSSSDPVLAKLMMNSMAITAGISLYVDLDSGICDESTYKFIAKKEYQQQYYQLCGN